MKNPNGYGSVSKLSGKRRRPYIVRITAGFDMEGSLKSFLNTLLSFSFTVDKLLDEFK